MDGRLRWIPRGALALGESRAAPVRSGWAGATQRGRGNGGEVVRKRGDGNENMYSKVLRWDSLDFSKKIILYSKVLYCSCA